MSKLLNSTRLEHMLEAAERIARRMPDVSLIDFLADEDLLDIALRRFMVIGEASFARCGRYKGAFSTSGLVGCPWDEKFCGSRILSG